MQQRVDTISGCTVLSCSRWFCDLGLYTKEERTQVNKRSFAIEAIDLHMMIRASSLDPEGHELLGRVIQYVGTRDVGQRGASCTYCTSRREVRTGIQR